MKHKRLWLALGGLLICMIGVLATYHDATRYKQPLIQVTAVKTIQKTKTTDDYQNQDTEVQAKSNGAVLEYEAQRADDSAPKYLFQITGR
ncbi:hypothetical protein QY884_10160 [Latilactobacillus sakei]